MAIHYLNFSKPHRAELIELSKANGQKLIDEKCILINIITIMQRYSIFSLARIFSSLSVQTFVLSFSAAASVLVCSSIRDRNQPREKDIMVRVRERGKGIR